MGGSRGRSRSSDGNDDDSSLSSEESKRSAVNDEDGDTFLDESSGDFTGSSTDEVCRAAVIHRRFLYLEGDRHAQKR